jgi:hypothetical protein
MRRSFVLALGVAAIAWLALGVAAASGHPGDTNFPTHQHGGDTGHLPATSKNVKLVGKASVVDVVQGAVADVGSYGNYAYLGKYDEGGCDKANIYVMDISNPSAPRQVGVILGHEDTYISEGVQVVHVETASFKGEILVQNNEACSKNGKGGVSLWNVTNPLKPVKLVDNMGDFTGGSSTNPNDKNAPHIANEIHSAFAWQQGSRAFAVMVDNEQFPDVDILEITNPKKPVLVAETGIDDWPGIQDPFGQWLGTGGFASTGLHDMVVKNVNGTWTMLLSYWDGGWVTLNVNDPANPTFIADSDYPIPDSLFPQFAVSEGNAHQAEYTADNKYIIGTDEDFSPYRSSFSITSGPNADDYPAGEFGFTPPITSLPDKSLNGPTVYGGYGCPAGDAASIPPASVLDPYTAAGEDQILVLQRGPVNDPANSFEACFFSEKIEHSGAGGGTAPDVTLCGSQGHVFTPTIPALCLGHRPFHLLFNTAVTYTYPESAPAIGAIGEKVAATAQFDGWGYIRLLDAQTLQEVDAWAIDEALAEQYAFGFGELSVHEVATDPDNAALAYYAYYSGGFRVTKTSGAGLTEVGRYIDAKGNNFWGVEVHKHPNGQKYILASDRDSGLWIFQYTGR